MSQTKIYAFKDRQDLQNVLHFIRGGGDRLSGIRIHPAAPPPPSRTKIYIVHLTTTLPAASITNGTLSPGSTTATVYELTPASQSSPTLTAQPSPSPSTATPLQKTVYNITQQEITPQEETTDEPAWCLAVEDSFGKLIVVAPFPTPEVYPYTFGTLREDLNLFRCEGGAEVEFATCVVTGTAESGGSAWETSNIFSVFQNFGQLKLPLNLMQMPNMRMPVWRFPQWLFPAWNSANAGGGSGGSPTDTKVYGTGSFSDFDWWLPKGTPVTCAYNPIAMRWEVMDFYIPDFFATLNSDLQKDSCASVSLKQGQFDGRSTLTACAPPGMICQGEKIESGESVLVRWFHPQKQWYVIAASCPCESTGE